MSDEVMNAILDTVENKENQPLLIFCTVGRVKTGCVVGCLRKSTSWSMASISAEFEQFADLEGALCDLQFVEAFSRTSTILNQPNTASL